MLIWFTLLLRDAVNAGPLVRALTVTLPAGLLYCLTGNGHWLLTILVAISLFIGIERVGLAPLGVLAQTLAIGAGFLLLSFGWSRPWAFVLVCTLLAAAAVAVSLAGARLRSLGNFVFIPTLYLVFETAEAKESVFALFPYAALATAPVLVLACLDVLKEQAWRPRASAFMRWRRPLDLGLPARRIEALSAVSAIIIAVPLATIMVQWRQWPHGQWMVWSAASVVTGSTGAAGSKLRDRAIGALIGVPLGLLVGVLLPRSSGVDATLAVASALTLVAFRDYKTSFAARCACIACASWLVQQSVGTAAERIVNVLLGGAIGVACVYGCDRLIRYGARRFARYGAVPPHDVESR